MVEMSCNHYIILVFYFTADFPKVFQQNSEGRIVNGFDTEKALPYQLSILVVANKYKKSHICGATLLTSKYAISALHCFIIWDKSKGPSINDVSPNYRFLGYPPSPCLLKSASKCLLFGHFLYPPPSPFGETSFMDGPLF